MRRILLLSTFVLMAVAGLFAQGVTTSTMSGTVKDQKGGAVPGANIVATHEPSGTTYGSVSLADGRFSIPNMRVGGPYKVRISFVGYGEQVFNDVYLKLGETYVINATLAEEGTQLEEIVVSGTQDKIMNSDRNGAITSISTREIMSMPTISRSMNDMIRFTPQATSNSNGAIGGGNYRQNYITIDGSDFNNTFGIGGNLPANGSPISLDALEEISVNITPYDVRQANFIGSSINAVTRSGTNEFSGSAYTFWRNENQQGNKVGDNPRLTRAPLDIKTYGIRLGGPIIKNKLFFFFNYEQTNETRPGQLQVAATSTTPGNPGTFDPANNPNVSRPLASDLDEIRQYLRENYGYETGPYQGYDNESNSNKFTARVDWNINQNHRINVRYSQVESKSPSFPSTSVSGSGLSNPVHNRQSNYALFFKNAGYFQEANFYSLAVEANSLFGKVANTLRATFTHQNDPRSSGGGVFPFVDILDGSGDFSIYTSFGYELFTYGNLRDVKTYSIVDYATLTSGIHTITAGIQADFQKTKNGFQRFGTGYYVFNSWDDFVNGENPINYAITFSLSPGYKQAFPNIGYNQYSVYAQDEMAINDRFKLTAGIRFDLPTFPQVDGIKTHPLVEPLEFYGGRKMDSGVLPKTRVMVSPRVGFNWDVKGDRSLQVRGGTGIFTGRVPTVWLVAQSGDAGLLQFTQTYSGQGNTPGPFSPDIKAYLPAVPPVAGTSIPSTFSAIDPDFKFPQAWKTSVAVDKKLPFGIVGTLEVIYTKDLNTAIGINPNINDGAAEPLNVDGYPDNRLIYPASTVNRFKYKLSGGQANEASGSAWNPIMLSNGNKGHYYSVSAKFEKQFDKGFSAFVAYTRSGAKVLYDGSGDQLINTWQNTQIATGIANRPDLSTAGYVVPDRVIASVSYRKEYLKKLATTVSLFYEGSISGRFSYTYSTDFNRDGQSNDLIYIPKDPSEITFTDHNYGNGVVTAQEQSDIFFAYIEQDKYLKKHKGEYATRNGATMPWRNQFDFRLTQDLFTDIGGRKNTLQFTLDIFNVGNLLNPKWGIFKQVNAANILVPTNVNDLVPGGVVEPTFRLQSNGSAPVSTTFRDNNSIISTYYMQFGLRYIFN